MKNTIIAAMILTSLNVKAEVSQKVDLFNVNVKGGIMSFDYSVGGGCREHTPKVVVTIEKTKCNPDNYEGHKAVLTVYDTAPEKDGCESYMAVSGTVDLKEVIKAELEKRKLEKADGEEIYICKIELPSLQADGNFYPF